MLASLVMNTLSHTLVLAIALWQKGLPPCFSCFSWFAFLYLGVAVRRTVLTASCMLRFAVRRVCCDYVGVSSGGLSTRMRTVGCRWSSSSFSISFCSFLSLSLSFPRSSFVVPQPLRASMTDKPLSQESRVPWSFRWTLGHRLQAC